MKTKVYRLQLELASRHEKVSFFVFLARSCSSEVVTRTGALVEGLGEATAEETSAGARDETPIAELQRSNT